MEECVSMAPWIGVISAIIGWTFFLITLAMLRRFISQGVSVAIAEMIFNNADEEMRIRMLRWFGNGDEILAQVHRIEERIDREQKSLERRKKSS